MNCNGAVPASVACFENLRRRLALSNTLRSKGGSHNIQAVSENLTMHFIGRPQVLWPTDVFEKHPIPMDARDFLMNVGLPEFFDWPAYEFGVFDSEGPDLVIGEDAGYPVFVEGSSGSVFAQGEPAGRRWFLNSSVELLSRFLYLTAELQRMSDDPAAKHNSLTHMRQVMLQLDPTALASPSDCVWAHWLEEWQLDFPGLNNAHEPTSASVETGT